MIHFTHLWGLGALLSIPVIILLYAFRPKRMTLRVSSNRLWREARRERQKGLGLQKLLRDLSLLLLLLFALALSLGLAGIGWSTHSTERNDVVLVLDISASMQAKAADGSTRLQLAKQQAGRIIDSLDRKGRLLLMTSGRRATMRTAFESDRATLESALKQVSATDEAGNPEQAIALAVSLLRSREQGRVYFVTDGAFDDLGDLDTTRVEFRVIEGTNRNVAITRFDFRREVGSDDRHQVLVTARNYTGDPIVAALNLELNDQPLLNQTLELGPDETRTLVMPVQGRINGTAKVSVAYGDDFSQDNEAFAIVRQAEPMKLLLLSPGNAYLESVLHALPAVTVDRSDTPADDFASQADQYDAIILDRVAPPELPPGNYLLVDVIPSGLPFAAGEQITQPEIEGNAIGTMFNDVDLSGLIIDRARKIVHMQESPGLQRLFWMSESDLALALVEKDLRIVLLGFDLADSNFPLQASFPLFLGESLSWLHPRLDHHTQSQVSAGEPVTIATPEQHASVVVQTPLGKTLSNESLNGELQFRQTDQAGIYRYIVGEIEHKFAVNLTDEKESDIQTRAELPTASETSSTARVEGRTDILLWPYLVVLALALLIIEWSLWCWRGVGA